MKTLSLFFAAWLLCTTQLCRSPAAAQAVSPPAASPEAPLAGDRPNRGPAAPAATPVVTGAQPAADTVTTAADAAPAPAVGEPQLVEPEGACTARKLEQLQGDVTALRVAMVQLLAQKRAAAEQEERARKQAHWVRSMEVKRDAIRVRPSAGLLVGATLAAGVFGGLMVRSDYATGAIIMTSLTAALAVGAAVKLGRLVHARRAIERELRAGPR